MRGFWYVLGAIGSVFSSTVDFLHCFGKYGRYFKKPVLFLRDKSITYFLDATVMQILFFSIITNPWSMTLDLVP